MAKGIVVKKPDGMTAGKIIVTDPTSSGVISTGGGGSVIGGTPAPIDIGSIVNFADAGTSELGDLVDFTYDGTLGSSLKTTTKGTVISGPYADNVVINSGECVLISGGNLEGKIRINGGTLVVIGSSYLAGKVQSATAGSFILVDQQSTVEGKLEISGASTLSYRNSTVEGKLTTNGTLFTAVTNCTVHGKLEVLNAKVCQCTSNTVVGDTNTPGCPS